MLNEIRQNEELRNRRLVDLYEEGILELGDEVPYIHREETYVSLEEKNGFGNQKFSTKDFDMKWQAIGLEIIDGNKCLKLIAKEPAFNVTLRGARGCVYGIDEVHKICSLFATGYGALKGRSITIKDVNQLLDVVVDEEQGMIYQKGYEKDINKNKDFFKKYLLDEEFYTPEGYLAGEETQKKPIIETYYWYKIGSIIGKEKEKNIVQRSVNYSLASPGVSVVSDSAYFGPGAVVYGLVASGRYALFRSDGYEGNHHLAVRPILYLKSNETFSSLLGRKENISGLSIENLLEQLEEKRQERQKIEKEEEKIIKQLEEIIR